MQDLFCILFRKTVTAQAQQLDILPTRCHTRQKPEKASCGIILQLAMFFLRLQPCDSMPETISLFRTNTNSVHPSFPAPQRPGKGVDFVQITLEIVNLLLNFLLGQGANLTVCNLVDPVADI